MALTISGTHQEPSTLSVVLSGTLDAVSGPELDQYLADSLTDGVVTVVFDLAALTFVSSAGLRLFAKTRKSLSDRGGTVVFVNLSPQVKKVFEIVKAVPLSGVFASTEELDTYLASMQRKAADAARTGW